MARKITTGVEKAYFAILDNENGVNPVYKPVSYLQGLQEFSIVANEETATIYAENKTWETENAIGEIEVSLTFASIYTPDYVALLGKKLSNMGGVIESSDDEAPYIALMLEKTLSGGVKEYLTLYKGKLRIPEDVARTKEGATEFQVKTLAGTFMPLNNGMWKHVFKSDDIGFDASKHAVNWGKEVIIPTAMNPTALTVAQSTPTANQQSVTVNSTLTLKFSNKLADHSFKLTKADGTEVGATATLNEDGVTLNIKPNANLTATNKHTLAVTVKDLFGQVINHTLEFTTA